MEIEKAEKFILYLLSTSLSPTLFYHGLHHTLDVTQAALIIADDEGVKDETALKLLKTAALFHDSGFLYTYKNHEEEGCRIARSKLPLFAYSGEEIEQICGLIMATKIPQSPKNQLEAILCDADLDYLGRNDLNLSLKVYLKNYIPGKSSKMKKTGMIFRLNSWNLINIIQNLHEKKGICLNRRDSKS